MYFYKKQGKQYLDLTGNLILSHNSDIIKARVPSAAPIPRNIKYVMINKTVGKFKATWAVIWFIWGKSTALNIEDTDFNAPRKKDDN